MSDVATECFPVIAFDKNVVTDGFCRDCDDRAQKNTAIFFCKECKKHLCAGCHKYHLQLFRKHPIYCIETSRNRKRTYDDIKLAAVGPEYMFTIDEIDELGIRLPNEKVDCCVTGICQLADGTYIIVDQGNGKIKHIDGNNKFKIVATCSLPSWPHSVCSIDGDTIAVTVWRSERHELHFIRVAVGKMIHKNVVKLDHICKSIAHSKEANMLLIATRNTINTYTSSGEFVRELYRNTKGMDTVSDITISRDGNLIFLTDQLHKKIIQLDHEGNTVNAFTYPDLGDPYGVCLSHTSNHAFVCGDGPDTIIQIDGAEKNILTLATEMDGVMCPHSLFFDAQRHMLVVGLDRGENILVVKLK
ncbi:hypothetical protein DPMN_001237 [Dreissena polymorpha]|uniref:B box-type domain-containing protein n=1 Tax=Dreissena polymorpha TaxID=45954 RepID=A0A9D4MKK7_DREPO|nr:hypothetical protein DPMN_001237 [Dreissena polymorpha]